MWGDMGRPFGKDGHEYKFNDIIIIVRAVRLEEGEKHERTRLQLRL